MKLILMDCFMQSEENSLYVSKARTAVASFFVRGGSHSACAGVGVASGISTKIGLFKDRFYGRYVKRK